MAALWERYDRLLTDTKEKLDLPMRWLSKSLRHVDPHDAMIDIGVALEALFLDQEIGEQHRYRLALNGSLWLENGLPARLAVSTRLRNAYDMRSASVHASPRSMELSEVVEARRLAARGVLLALERASIPQNWNTWILERFPAN
jgi:hypothetical protein